MKNMPDPKVTILIPNYKTLKITKLCLRLLRKYTDPGKICVIVIDNDSNDESLVYLKRLEWIKLLQRKRKKNETPGLSHASALDLALKHVTTPYVLSMHTDTLVKNDQWLEVLLAEIEKDTSIAGVGSWKLEPRPTVIKRIYKIFEYQIRWFYYRLLGKSEKIKRLDQHRQSGYYNLLNQKKNQYGSKENDLFFLRSHCALYRMDLLKRFNLSFADGHETAGKGIHKKLVKNGYKMIFLAPEYLIRYMIHLNHATMVLHPELGSKRKTIFKGKKRITMELARLDADKILLDDSLDN